MKFKVIEENCIGCGLCQTVCPECFEIKGGLAKVINFELDNCCDLQEVIESCPCQAIEFEDKK